jgi:uncharacterized protein DUF6580
MRETRVSIPRVWSTIIVVGLVTLAAVSRVVHHPWNFTPMVALALLSGAGLRNPLASVLLTLTGIAAGDVALGQFPYAGIGWVYGAMVVVTLGGRLLRGRRGLLGPLAAGLASGLAFFAITNFGFWLAGTLYPRTGAGLATCFAAAVPFYRNQLAADTIFTVVLFGAKALVERLAARHSLRITAST